MHFFCKPAGYWPAGAIFLVLKMPGNALLKGRVLRHGMCQVPFFVVFIMIYFMSYPINPIIVVTTIQALATVPNFASCQSLTISD